MSLESLVRTTFLRRLISTPAGRAHLLNLMIHAEEGDEAGVFDQLQRVVTDRRVQKTIARHQADEREHADLYRECLRRTGIEPDPIPDELLIIRRAARVAGGMFASGARDGAASTIATNEDVMNTYALLLAIEERGVQQFPLIGREFRRIGDHETADTFDRVARDEARHCKYCRAIGRSYAPSEAAWCESVARYKAIEAEAFQQVGVAGIAYAVERGLVWQNPAIRNLARWLSGSSND